MYKAPESDQPNQPLFVCLPRLQHVKICPQSHRQIDMKMIYNQLLQYSLKATTSGRYAKVLNITIFCMEQGGKCGQ